MANTPIAASNYASELYSVGKQGLDETYKNATKGEDFKSKQEYSDKLREKLYGDLENKIKSTNFDDVLSDEKKQKQYVNEFDTLLNDLTSGSTATNIASDLFNANKAKALKSNANKTGYDKARDLLTTGQTTNDDGTVRDLNAGEELGLVGEQFGSAGKNFAKGDIARGLTEGVGAIGSAAGQGVKQTAGLLYNTTMAPITGALGLISNGLKAVGGDNEVAKGIKAGADSVRSFLEGTGHHFSHFTGSLVSDTLGSVNKLHEAATNEGSDNRKLDGGERDQLFASGVVDALSGALMLVPGGAGVSAAAKGTKAVSTAGKLAEGAAAFGAHPGVAMNTITRGAKPPRFYQAVVERAQLPLASRRLGLSLAPKEGGGVVRGAANMAKQGTSMLVSPINAIFTGGQLVDQEAAKKIKPDEELSNLSTLATLAGNNLDTDMEGINRYSDLGDLIQRAKSEIATEKLTDIASSNTTDKQAEYAKLAPFIKQHFGNSATYDEAVRNYENNINENKDLIHEAILAITMPERVKDPITGKEVMKPDEGRENLAGVIASSFTMPLGMGAQKLASNMRRVPRNMYNKTKTKLDRGGDNG